MFTLSKDKSKIRVKMRIGHKEVFRTINENELENFLKNPLEKKIEPETHSVMNKKNNQKETCESLIISLWAEKWFKISRTAAEVHDELSWRGYKRYGKSRISHCLANLTKDGYFIRLGTNVRYRYIQKDLTL